MDATKWRKWLALLVGAVLMAALAVAAALLFRADDPDPAEMEPAQEPSVRETAMSESGKDLPAPDAKASGAQETEQEQGKKPSELNSRPEIQTTPDDVPGIERWTYDPSQSKKMNRIRKYLYDQYGSSDIHRKENGRTPRGVIEILVEGMDDLTAAKYLYYGSESDIDERWDRNENEYALEYADRVLAKDPTSRDALMITLGATDDLDDAIESARRLIKYHPSDEDAVRATIRYLSEPYPEEMVAAVTRLLPEDGGLHSDPSLHYGLGVAYERLDMLYEAADQYQKAFAIGFNGAARGLYERLERGERTVPSIWEERDAAMAEAASQTPLPAEAPAPQRQPDAPRSVEPPLPPPNLEAEMSEAYADFAKAYQSAFEMEYALSEATPEGYMNALLGMARAFAKAGDAQHAQDAYNAVRKRHSREEVEQVFRRFDEQERLKSQPPSDEEDDDEDE